MDNHKPHPSCARVAQHIGNILLVHRVSKGFTQAHVAEQIGKKQASSVARFEQGKSSPSLDTLIRLTILLEIDPNLYFEGLVISSSVENETEELPLSLDELRGLVEPFQDPKIRRVVEQNINQLDDPEAASFVKGLVERTPAMQAKS